MKIEAKNRMGDTTSFGSALYDLEKDPSQNTVINDPKMEERMKGYILEFMKNNEAPAELYERLGINE